VSFWRLANETSGFIKSGNVLTISLSSEFLKKDSVPWRWSVHLSPARQIRSKCKVQVGDLYSGDALSESACTPLIMTCFLQSLDSNPGMLRTIGHDLPIMPS
jgi:hypothetical protein